MEYAQRVHGLDHSTVCAAASAAVCSARCRLDVTTHDVPPALLAGVSALASWGIWLDGRRWRLFICLAAAGDTLHIVNYGLRPVPGLKR